MWVHINHRVEGGNSHSTEPSWANVDGMARLRSTRTKSEDQTGGHSTSVTLGLQVPSKKVFGVGLEGPNTEEVLGALGSR